MDHEVVLIDTDPGVDDCAAIMMLLAAVPKVKIVGITCANGNVGMHQVTMNAARILQLFDMLEQIPIFQGCHEPMVSMPGREDSSHYHGKDGLGDVPNVYPPFDEKLLSHVKEEHAVHAINRLSREYAGKLQMLCIGALTNIAMAAKMDPELPKRLKGIHILGGTIKGYGNSTPCAEYNFYTDPEAAFNIFRDFPQHCPTEVVPWEVSLNHGVPFDIFDKMLSGAGKRKYFFRNVFENCRSYENRSISTGISNGVSMCDSYSAAILIDPEVVEKSKYVKVGVETGGFISRGSFIIDHKNKGSPYLSTADVRIIEEINKEKYMKLLRQAFDE